MIGKLLRDVLEEVRRILRRVCQSGLRRGLCVLRRGGPKNADTQAAPVRLVNAIFFGGGDFLRRGVLPISLAMTSGPTILRRSIMKLADLLLLAQAAPGAPQQPNLFMSMMPLIFIFIIFYFLLIRPQQKKAKDHAKLVESIKTGDAVVTHAGIHGVVTNVKEKTVLIKIADNVKVEFDRAAVVTVVKSSDTEASAS